MIETASVQGNIINSTPITFVVESSQEGKPVIIQLSARNGRASVEFHKVDQDGNPHASVQFALYSVSGERILIYNSLFSQNDGIVHIDQLSPGSYHLEEVMTVAGYILNTSTIAFEVPAQAQTEHLVITLDDFVNYQGSIRITKVNRLDRLIGEAVFEIYFGDELIQTLTTVNGVLMLTGLAIGVSTFVEMEAPEGYILNDTPLVVTIAASHEGSVETKEFRFVNLGGDLLGDGEENIPPTGDSTNGLPWLLLLFGVAAMVYSNKKKKLS